MKRTFAAAVAAPPLLAIASAALANRPLTTDTADVIETGTYQLETYASRVTASGVPAENGWTSQLSRGMGYRTQLSAAISRARAGGESASGLLLGGKTWLVELGEAAPGLTVGYGLTGVNAPGDSWRHDGSYLTLIGTQPFGKSLLVHANLGWVRSSIAKQDSTAWALGVEYSTEAKVNLIAETFGDDRGKPTFSLGLLWAPLEKFSVNTSYGVTRESPRIKQWTLGFQLDF
jgi:hypothetical protein